MRVRTPLKKSISAERQRHRADSTRHRWRRALAILLTGLALALLVLSPTAQRPSNEMIGLRLPPWQRVGEIAVVDAPGFDTCVAPPEDLLETWWEQSPYRWLNLYLGGASMFPDCGGKNLTPEWIRDVYEQGWSLLPTWVGPQAPCAAQRVVMSSDTAVSYAEGMADADSAIEASDLLGISAHAPIYFDMEYFSLKDAHGARNQGCILAVNAFLNGWNSELGAHGHLAGVYASASDYPVLGLSAASVPLVAWIAGGAAWTRGYDRACTVYGNKYVSDDAWNTQTCIYQYTGGHDETYGHKTWNIDSDCADAPMVGHVTTTALNLPPQSP